MELAKPDSDTNPVSPPGTPLSHNHHLHRLGLLPARCCAVSGYLLLLLLLARVLLSAGVLGVEISRWAVCKLFNFCCLLKFNNLFCRLIGFN